MREYYTDNELKEISNWYIKYAHNLIDRLRDMWMYNDYFIENWDYSRIDKKKPVLKLSLHTGGWSGNEDIIKALKDNELFWMMWWWKTERGGHYYFDLDYAQIGFKLVNEFLKEHGTYRQYIYKFRDKYEWIKISHGKRLIREVEK